MRTARSGASGRGTGSLKKIIMPSPVNRSSVPSCSRIRRPISAWYSRSTPMTAEPEEVMGVVLPQHPHDLLGLGGLGERGEPAEVEEDHGHLAAMALEGVLGVAAHDQLGELRREEAFQAIEAFELGHLRRDALLERAVPLGQLVVELLDPKERPHAGE